MYCEDGTVRYAPHPDHDGYMIGSDGSVWSCWGHGPQGKTDKWKRKSQCNGGFQGNYAQTGIGNARVYIHRLVLEAFVGPCPPGMEACHNDGNPKNNRLENLRWDTKTANQADRVTHGTDCAGEKAYQHKLTRKDVEAIRVFYAAGGRMSYREMGERYGVNPSAIYKVVRGVRWKVAT